MTGPSLSRSAVTTTPDRCKSGPTQGYTPKSLTTGKAGWRRKVHAKTRTGWRRKADRRNPSDRRQTCQDGRALLSAKSPIHEAEQSHFCHWPYLIVAKGGVIVSDTRRSVRHDPSTIRNTSTTDGSSSTGHANSYPRDASAPSFPNNLKGVKNPILIRQATSRPILHTCPTKVTVAQVQTPPGCPSAYLSRCKRMLPQPFRTCCLR